MAGERKDYDAFFLDHLQSVRGGAAWYRNHRFIGKGGNGTTFFVACTSGELQGFNFALKVFHRVSDTERRDRFLAEVRHYRTLSHPSIIRVYDEGTFSTQRHEYPFAIIDFVPENLEMKLGWGAPTISRHQSISYVLNVASAIRYLHTLENPIVHRDIKPANILVSGPTARLGDLGLAKVIMGDRDEHIEDVRSYVAMPRFYRTPELIAFAHDGRTRITPASDIYQLGLVLYRALTGYSAQRPAQRDAALDPIELDMRPLGGASGDELTDLLGRMLKVDPTERPDAGRVLDELNRIHVDVCRAHHAAAGVTV